MLLWRASGLSFWVSLSRKARDDSGWLTCAISVSAKLSICCLTWLLRTTLLKFCPWRFQRVHSSSSTPFANGLVTWNPLGCIVISSMGLRCFHVFELIFCFVYWLLLFEEICFDFVSYHIYSFPSDWKIEATSECAKGIRGLPTFLGFSEFDENFLELSARDPLGDLGGKWCAFVPQLSGKVNWLEKTNYNKTFLLRW